MPAKITSTLISGATFLATANTGLETTLLSAYGTNLNEIDPMTVRPPNPASLLIASVTADAQRA